MRAPFLPNNLLCPACRHYMFVHNSSRIEAGQTGVLMSCSNPSCVTVDKHFLVELPTVEMTELLLPVGGEV